jgi:glycosyltransferase involved in cell wall biosynthesis
MSSPLAVPRARAAERPRLSVIAPVFNEAGVIEEFVLRVTAVLDGLSDSYSSELILVDDVSRDDSLLRMRRLSETNPRLRVVELACHAGQSGAIQAGFDHARGEILVTLDSDLQHVPEEIPALLAALQPGVDLVCGWRKARVEGPLRRWPSRVANLLLARVSGVPLHDFGTTFRAYRAEVVHRLRLLGEFHRYLPVLAGEVGGRIVELPIRNEPRRAGNSSYGLARTLGVTLDLVMLHFLSRYIDRPLRGFGKVALAGFALGGGILGVLLVMAWVSGVATVREHSGWFIISVMLLIGSLQILLTGLLAEILVRVHFTAGEKRRYTVRNEWSGGRTAG